MSDSDMFLLEPILAPLLVLLLERLLNFGDVPRGGGEGPGEPTYLTGPQTEALAAEGVSLLARYLPREAAQRVTSADKHLARPHHGSREQALLRLGALGAVVPHSGSPGNPPGCCVFEPGRGLVCVRRPQMIAAIFPRYSGLDERTFPLRDQQVIEFTQLQKFPGFGLHSEDSLVSSPRTTAWRALLVSLWQDGRAFTRDDVHCMRLIVPHLDRAWRLQMRLSAADLRADIVTGAFDCLNVGTAFVDRSGRFQWLNRRAREILGSSAELRLTRSDQLLGRRAHRISSHYES
jgi:hypothetical protein